MALSGYNLRRNEYRVSCIPQPLSAVGDRGGGSRFVYNLALVRQLCQDIADEKELQRLSDLADLLQAVIKEDQEEIRLRIAFLARLYPAVAAYSAD